MAVFVYDGSFWGLLSCIFKSYQQKITPDKIERRQVHQPLLIGQTLEIETSNEHAQRVISGLNKRTEGQAEHLFYKVFLSEDPSLEMLLFNVAKLILERGDKSALENFADSSVFRSFQLAKMMDREIHRMHAFVRFQLTKDGLFFANIEPDFDVLPLIGEHFEKRYADQPWLIFDVRRQYGLYYDLSTTSLVTIDDPEFDLKKGRAPKSVLNEKEAHYQSLWENYFQSVNIKERKNKKLHLQHVPKRYWKYLPEKRS